MTVGLVRDKHGYHELKKLGVADDQIRIGDITDRSTMAGVFDDASKVIMCTSARPKKKFWFRLINFLLKIIGRDRPPQATDLYYPKNQCPYNVDFIGQKNVIDLCLDAKVEHIVMLGNMGGYRGSKLNAIGREEGETSPKKGNLLKWKRAAERYLMKRCFFTIVHSGALIDEKGGRREIVWDTDDALLRTNFRKIPREDVAEVLVQALVCKDAIGKLRTIADILFVDGSRPQVLYSISFYSISFCSISFYSISFYSISFYSFLPVPRRHTIVRDPPYSYSHQYDVLLSIFSLMIFL